MTPKNNLITPLKNGYIVRNIKFLRKEIKRILSSKSKIVYIVIPKKS